jgi:hypothetical protein
MIRLAFVVACLLLTGATAATPTHGPARDVLPYVPPAPTTSEC